MSEKRLTITDIESKNFLRVASGYDPKEVDAFLDCICDEMETLQGEIDELNSQLSFARAETRKAEAASGFVTPAETAPDADFREILEMAKRVKDMTIADAQKKAEEIVADAQAQADAVLGGLEEERVRLSEALSDLRTQARTYRDAVANLISEQQTLLDAVDLGEDEE